MSEAVSSGDFVLTGGDPPPTPTDHELNKVLAKWAGVDVINVGMGVWIYYDKADKKRWHPLTDANQMELVEEWLRSHGYDFTIEWRNLEQLHYVSIKEREILRTVQTAISKKRALALAIREMTK